MLPICAAALLALGLGTTETGSTRAVSERTANLWIDADGGSCVRRPSRGAYVDARACATLQAAANAARDGDLVLIRAGRYPGQQLTGSRRTTFVGAGPGRPSFGQLIVRAGNPTFRHLLVENRDAPTQQSVCSYFDFTLFTCGPNQTYDDVVVDGLKKGSGDPARRGGLQVEDASRNLVFRNGVIRGIADAKGFQGGADRMLIENTLFHDIRLTPAGEAAGVHNECAYVTGGDDQTWRRNRFVHCPVMAMFFPNYDGGPPFTGVTIENNVFTHTLDSNGAWHGSSPFVIPDGANRQNLVTNWVVRYNTFEVSPNFGSTPGTADDNGSARFYGNLGADGACGVPEWTYSYNVGETCGGLGEVAVRPATNNRSRPNQAPFYVNAPAGDFRLRAGSPALNRGHPEAHPRADRGGVARPVGSAPDAGAYERVANATTGILSIGDGGAPPGLRLYARKNPARLLVALGGPRSSFAALRRVGVPLAAARHQVRRLGGVEIVVVGAEADAATTRWLRRTLARRTRLFRIVVVGDSPFACGAGQANARIRSSWVPLFERHRVGLVLSARARNYQRFDRGGVTYAAHGGGTGVSSPGACPAGFPTRLAARATRTFLYVTVDAGGVLARVNDARGRTIDRFRVPATQ